MRLALFLSLTIAVVVAMPADAKIVVQHGMGGVTIGMTQAQVRAKIGPPAKVISRKNDGGRFTEFFYPRIAVFFQPPPRVVSIGSDSRLEKTSTGVGIGSYWADVKKHVRGAHCRTTYGHGSCLVGDRVHPGRVYTEFKIVNRSILFVEIVLVGPGGYLPVPCYLPRAIRFCGTG
jgi:hypothetical protein